MKNWDCCNSSCSSSCQRTSSGTGYTSRSPSNSNSASSIRFSFQFEFFKPAFLRFAFPCKSNFPSSKLHLKIKLAHPSNLRPSAILVHDAGVSASARENNSSSLQIRLIFMVLACSSPQFEFFIMREIHYAFPSNPNSSSCHWQRTSNCKTRHNSRFPPIAFPPIRTSSCKTRYRSRFPPILVLHRAGAPTPARNSICVPLQFAGAPAPRPDTIRVSLWRTNSSLRYNSLPSNSPSLEIHFAFLCNCNLPIRVFLQFAFPVLHAGAPTANEIQFAFPPIRIRVHQQLQLEIQSAIPPTPCSLPFQFQFFVVPANEIYLLRVSHQFAFPQFAVPTNSSPSRQRSNSRSRYDPRSPPMPIRVDHASVSL